MPASSWIIASAYGAEGGIHLIDTKAATSIIDYPTSDVVSFATVAVQVGDELWVGSARGDRIARYPAKGLRPPR